jgi:putative FmdB family regulatory protein
MPIFEYACRECSRTFEAFVTAERTPGCPSCGSTALDKLLSSPGMVGVAQSSGRSDPGFPAGSCGAGGAGCACRGNLTN